MDGQHQRRDDPVPGPDAVMTGIRQIARELGVHPSTVSRRVKAGKDPRAPHKLAGVPRPTGKPRYPGLAEQIAVRAAAGMGGDRIAADLGIARRQTIYDVARREGIQLPGQTYPAESLRRAIQDMKPADALEIVLEAYEQAIGFDAERQADLMARGLTNDQALIMMALEGRGICTYDHLASAVSHARIEPTTEEAIKAQVCLMRAKIQDWPVRIETVWGFGYRLVAKDKS